MKRLLLLMILFSQIICAQGKLKFEIDYADFRIDSSMTNVEFYYSFTASNLKVDSGKVKAQLNLILINKENKKEVINKKYQFVSLVDSTIISSDQVGMLSYPLNYGKYECTVNALDVNDSSNYKNIKFDINLLKRDLVNFEISSIEVGSWIKQDSQNKESNFYKNTLEIIPNPSNIFGINFPVIFFYSELYNVDKNIKCDKLRVDHILINSKNKNIFQKSKFITRKNNSIVDLGAIRVDKYPTGTYNIAVTVSDTVSKVRKVALKKVYIYNPAILDTNTTYSGVVNVLLSELGQMTIDELNTLYEQSKYIASQIEIEKWKNIHTEVGKKNFLNDFWKRRDEDPFTPQNETMDRYFERVRFANSYYDNMAQKDGWKTDMGRIFILYGEPDEIERHPNDTNIRPYEIWTYEKIEGGVIFVFGDKFDIDNFRLLHSTRKGELSDPSWKKWLLVR